MRPDETSDSGVHLDTSGRDVLTGSLGKLASFYQLDVHGTAFLGNRARIEMGYGALLLTLIFLFDMMAWTILFNSIFHLDLLKIGWMTLLAVPIALLFSLAIFIYQRQFITADLSEARARVWTAIGIRMVILLMAALITAQPVELFIFRGPIQKRVREEGILKEVIERKKQLDEAKVQAEGVSAEKILEEEVSSVEYKELEEAETANKAAQDELEHAEGELDKTQAQIGSLLARRENLERSVKDLEQEIAGLESRQQASETQLVALRKDLIDAEKEQSRRSADFLEATDRLSAATDGDRIRLGDAVTRARSEFDTATKEVDALKERINELDKVQEIEDKKEQLVNLRNENNRVSGQLEGAKQRKQDLLGKKNEAIDKKDEADKARDESNEKFNTLRTTIRDDANRFKKQAEAQVRRLRNWVRELQSQEPGERVTESRIEPWPFDDPPWSYSDEQYDFFRQLRVLSDLREGKPTRWPDVSEEVKVFLAEEYGLENVSSLRDEARRRRDAESRQFRYTYYVVYFVALIIPLLLLVFKFLMAPELRSYYESSSYWRDLRKFRELESISPRTFAEHHRDVDSRVSEKLRAGITDEYSR